MSFEKKNNQKITICSESNMLPGCAEQFAIIRTTINQISDSQLNTNNKLDKIAESIVGNGKIGLTTRLDRIEQIERGRKWLLRTVGVAVIGLLAKMVWGFLA